MKNTQKKEFKVNLFDVLSELSGQGRREGRCFKFRSPFREERTASFAVYPESNSWYDFGLGEGGDIISFFRKLYNCSYREALAEIEAYALLGNNLSNELRQREHSEKLLNYDDDLILAIKPVKMENYFRRLGLFLPPRTGAFVLFIEKKEFVKYGYKNRYLAFPCPDRNNPRGLECRLMGKGGSKRLSLFKKEIWFYKRDSKHIAITESIFDCLAMMRLVKGDFSLLAMNGLGNKNKVIDFIKKNQPELILLALDNDSHGAGQKIQKELTKTFQEEGIQIKDLSQHYKNKGIKDFYRLLQVLRKEARQ